MYKTRFRRYSGGFMIEDFEYTKWLDSDGVPSYKKHEYCEEALGNV